MRPPPEAFTSKELRIVERASTPCEVQRFLNSLPYSHDRTLRSFRGVVRDWTAHCLEAALAAAAILEQHGYEPLLLDLESRDQLDHVMFLYRRRGLWGTVARSRDPGLHGRRPVFRRLRDLVDSYADPYVDLEGRIVAWGVCNLEVLGSYDWRLSERNVKKVENHLIEMKHTRFRMAEARYRYWHERYITFKQRRPDARPVYYTNRRTWTPGYPRNT